MKNTWTSIGTAALMTVLCGCVSEPRSYTTYAPAPRVPVPQPVPSLQRVTLLGEHHDTLRLYVQCDGSNAEERTLSARIGASMEGAVAERTAKVMLKDTSDIRLAISSKIIMVDQDGEYCRMNAEVSASLISPVNGQLMARKDFQAVLPRRVLGRDKAVSQLSATITKDVTDWARSVIEAVTEREINVAVLNIQLPPVTPRDAVRDSHAVSAIGSALSKMGGVVSYEYRGLDTETGCCQYRVAYFRRDYPIGLSNKVSMVLNTEVSY